MFGFQRSPKKAPAVHWIDVAARTIGFHEPPCPLRVSWQRQRGNWVVKIRPLNGAFDDTEQVRRWAQSFRPAAIDGDHAGISMQLGRIPPEWESLNDFTEVHQVELGTDGGRSRLHVRASPEGMAEIRRADAEGRPFILDQFAPIQRPRLTARQRYLLHSALDWGYYDVPRKITLEKMAHRLGVGLNTLSVVLRNAEASLVRNFVAFDKKPGTSARRPKPADADE